VIAPADRPQRWLDDPRLRYVGVLLSMAAVLAADLPWGDFHAHTHWRAVGWIPFVTPPVRAADILQNIALFLPLGFFAGLAARPLPRAIVKSVLLALPVSLLGEWSQLYSHSRFPSATDVSSNLIGAIFGAALACSAWAGRSRRATMNR
jgi:hypothetical protein